MKLTLKNIQKIAEQSDNTLTKRVCDYIVDEWGNYDDKKYIFTDILEYGCQNGTVGFLTYYADTTAFYAEYQDEINKMLAEVMDDIGTSDFVGVFGDKWDKEDPLALDCYNQNLLAWFGFEETMRAIGENFECLSEKI